MIESSMIKLILIVALNICFVWVWGYKEKLRKINIFKNEKLSIFWAFNILYVIVTAKAFEKFLDITLGFSYGLKYIERSIETPFFKVDYFGIKTLDDITKFLFDSGNFITLFIGLTGMLVAIYIYAVSVDNKLKKFMLLTLIGKEELFYLSFNIVILFFFGSKSIFLIGPIGYLIYLLVRSVYWTIKINQESKNRGNFDEVLMKIFAGKPEEIKDLYIEVKKSLYKAVKKEELMEIDDNKYYFNKLLDKYAVDLEKIINNENKASVIRFLYDLHDEAYRNKNDNIFYGISYLHIRIAEYYRENNNKEKFYGALCGMGKVYDYYHRNGTDKFELDVVTGFRFNSFGIYEQYKENFKEGIEWYCQKFRAIVEGIKKTEKNDDLYFFKQFIYLIEQEFQNKEDLKRDYKLLEKSVYFGILLYFKEEERKNKDNENLVEKTDKFVEFIEKRILNETDLIDLIELYEFIEEEIYGYYENSMKDRLNWDEYFRPKIELIRGVAHEVRTKGEIKKSFFKLLGKTNFEEWEKNKLLKDEELKGYINDKIDIEKSFDPYNNKKEDSEVEEEIKKLIKRINRFKKKANWLLNDLKEYEKELTLTDEEYQKVKELLKRIRVITKSQEDKLLVDSEISASKIILFKRELEKILSESRIIKWLKFLGKYKEGVKEKKGKTRYIGQYMKKEYFVELGDEGGTKAIAGSYGKGQNKAIEQIMMESIESKEEEMNSIEDALVKIKGEPWIILTGIGIHSFFYKESGKSRGNVVLRTDLGEEYFERYGEILKGIYKYKGTKIPIYNFSSDKKGIYILDSDDIVEFVHYDAKEEDKNNKNIEKRFDEKVGYSHLTIIETDKIIESGEIEKILKSGILKDYETKEEKLNRFKQLVWITFVQKGELKLKKDAKVYKVEFNG